MPYTVRSPRQLFLQFLLKTSRQSKRSQNQRITVLLRIPARTFKNLGRLQSCSPWAVTGAVAILPWLSRVQPMKQRIRKSQLQCSAQKVIVKGSEDEAMGAIVFQHSLSLAIPSLKSTQFLKCLQEVYWFYFLSLFLVDWNQCLFTRYCSVCWKHLF